MKTLFRHILLLLFPIRCGGCKKLGKVLCDECRVYLLKQDIKNLSTQKDTFCIYSYQTRCIKNIIWELKYKNNTLLRSELVLLLQPKLQKFFGDYHQDRLYLIPIPKTIRKTETRDFHHSLLLALEIERACRGIKVRDVLEKRGFGIRQVENTSRSARIENMYKTITRKNVSIENTSILCIIDDVTTTGATLNEAKRVLGEYHSRKILCLVLAH